MATSFKASGPHYPTRSTFGSGGYVELGNCDPFSQNFVCDKVIKELPLAIGNFTTAGTAKLCTMVSGACVIAEVNTAGIGGIVLESTKNQIAFSFKVPQDMDVAKEFAIRYEFMNRAGIKYSKATDIITTVSKWDALTASTVTAAAASTVFSDTTNTTTIGSAIYGMYNSTWDSVNDSAVLAAGLVAGDDRILVLTDFTLGSNVSSVFCTSIQLGYYRKLVGGG
jgi:hypothetical protein